MGRPKEIRGPLLPIWEAPDELWAVIEPILAERDPLKRGPKRIDQRAPLDAVIFRCGAAASGIGCPESTRTIARSTARSSGGSASGSSTASGPWSRRRAAWLSKCRSILIRWDKKAADYLGLLKLACVLPWHRRYRRLTT